jgi:hypothetical protein
VLTREKEINYYARPPVSGLRGETGKRGGEKEEGDVELGITAFSLA